VKLLSLATLNKVAKDHAVGLLVILALAAFLRFYGLGEELLWVDELYSLSFVSARTRPRD
jgi:hypothetical protein